jgi:hypothetical protein
LPDVAPFVEGLTVPIALLLNVDISNATKLLLAAVEQCDKLVNGAISEHASKLLTGQQPEFEVYKCPSCASESVFECAEPLELVRYWKYDDVFPEESHVEPRSWRGPLKY